MNRQIKLFVGLGNVGEKYKNTRHNVGFVVVDEIAKAKQLEFRVWNNMLISFCKIVGGKVCLLKPMTFMNRSGDAVCLFMRYYGIVPEEVFVFYDDFTIPIGEYRVRMSGSSGGHNGINSIIARLNTKNFPRMKLGVGPIPNFVKSEDYVLSEFEDNDEKKIDTIKKTVVKFFDNVCVFGLDKAASKIANNEMKKITDDKKKCNNKVLKKCPIPIVKIKC
ncbi:MAG: aminoacyl-tRNA hydrolase [Endomicrobium sp.]|jgi:PTH1 family peptidyl-tRNA hydrolase|nr:aminoacyl-tRNA hydrolase [Endomicrobium sp.]